MYVFYIIACWVPVWSTNIMPREDIATYGVDVDVYISHFFLPNHSNKRSGTTIYMFRGFCSRIFSIDSHDCVPHKENFGVNCGVVI